MPVVRAAIIFVNYLSRGSRRLLAVCPLPLTMRPMVADPVGTRRLLCGREVCRGAIRKGGAQASARENGRRKLAIEPPNACKTPRKLTIAAATTPDTSPLQPV